ncbi:hypothetical protein [Rhodococcus sp. 3-2]|uniref:hypothetical protein n=1 Tax=Rhodococcus sp. 3-2 TaxID=2890836 RepID=UPI001D187171|nr:hypothetical protein [Rhodococcus sp. 3-2]MCC4300405.1 hypothetical protein [Rhodococcus sp. 3-2]MCC4300465.1 hypothetical protein [Rhodococcus sp. 3-2]
MTAPDPGLTDLIAAHPRLPIHVFEDRHRYRCLCGWFEDVEPGEFTPHPAHVAFVVEQHTNGRITELEARIAEAQSLCNATGRYNAARQKHWNIRVFACDVLAALKGRAALEGEQQ